MTKEGRTDKEVKGSRVTLCDPKKEVSISEINDATPAEKVTMVKKPEWSTTTTTS
jgi:hypothetical protein